MGSGDGHSGDLAGALGAYETAPALMLAFEGDDMVLASANEAARDAFGDRFEFGRPLREIAPEVDERTQSIVSEMVATVLSTGRTVTRPAHRIELRGDAHPSAEAFWDLTFSPWLAEDGSVRGILAHGIDVTREARPDPTTSRQHEVVSLQDALLPEFLPVLPGVEIAGRYLVAEDERAAGGDWYDAIVLAEGRVALVTGDVASHGVPAAAAMGRLRSVLQERLTSGAGLHESMQALDAFARQVPEAYAATVCVVVLDPGDGRIEYCTAGHPPPLVVRAAGRCRYLPSTSTAPLATTGEISVGTDRIQRGDLLVLCTDGLLDRPGRSAGGSTVELGQVAADAAGAGATPSRTGVADRVCQQSLEVLTGRSGYDDDIVLLVACWGEPTAPLHLDLPADGTAVARALRALATWLGSLSVRELDHIVVQHSADELVTNVVEHAYPRAAPGRVAVDAELLPTGEIEIRVSDAGTWVPPDHGEERGHGLSMVRSMVDRLTVRGAEGGTVATVRHRLSQTAWMLTGTAKAGFSPPARSDEGFTLAADADGLHLAGSLDGMGLEHLHDALDDLPDSHRVVVDLRDVTRLPSCAVQALHAASRDAADRGQDLVLYAPAGTAAQQVLELVRLPYVVTDPLRR